MEIAELAIAKALNLGATEAETYVRCSKKIQIAFSTKVEDVKTTESTGLSIRTILGRRVASYSTSILGEREVGEAAERSLKIAKVAPEDPDWRSLNRRYGKSRVNGVFDKTIETLAYDEIIEQVCSAIKVMRESDSRVKPTRGMLAINTTRTSVANSHGDAAERKSTYSSASVNVKAQEAGLESTGGEHIETRSWNEIDLISMAESAVEKAVGYLGAEPISGKEMPVILRNQVAASLMGVMLSSPINAKTVQQGGSPFAGKLGERIAAENINVLDIGAMPNGFGSSPFDDEGHPTQNTPVIRRGVMSNFLYDSYTAQKEGRESTGNAWRSGYSTPPNPAPSNLVLERGIAEFDEILQETRMGLYVEETIGEWLSNPVSGNLNATVTHGYLIEEGELSKPVKGVILAGNYHEVLKEGFDDIGNDLRNIGNYYSPTVKVCKLTIAGE